MPPRPPSQLPQEEQWPRKVIQLRGTNWTVFRAITWPRSTFAILLGTYPAGRNPDSHEAIFFELVNGRVTMPKSAVQDYQRAVLVYGLRLVSEHDFEEMLYGKDKATDRVWKAWYKLLEELRRGLQSNFDAQRRAKANPKAEKNGRMSKRRARRNSRSPTRVIEAVPPEVIEVARRLSVRGGQVNLVGGAVIDLIQGRKVKDWDLEVFGLGWDELVRRARMMGRADEVGKSFGIVKLTLPSGLDLDLSIPRVDSKSGEGHKGFDVHFDPRMTPKEAARRRDFTINSMAVNLQTGEVIDPFGGLHDLEQGVLKVTDEERFKDDPLRGLRAMQLLARKAKTVDPDSMRIIRGMRHHHTELPKERLLEEWRKLLLKAEKPSVGLQFLKDSGWIEHYPELDVLEAVPQKPEWHPEGDVWTHTKQAADAAARIRHLVPEEQREAFMFGTTFHDLGKATTTITPEMVAAGLAPAEKLFTAHGHDVEGAKPMTAFAERLGMPTKTRELATGLVELHMQPYYLHAGKAGRASYARLARKLDAIHGDMELLARVCQCDACATGSGRGFTSLGEPDWEHDTSRNLLARAGEVGNVPPARLVQGRDLIALGVKPGIGMGELLKQALELQDEGWDRHQILEEMQRRLQ